MLDLNLEPVFLTTMDTLFQVVGEGRLPLAGQLIHTEERSAPVAAGVGEGRAVVGPLPKVMVFRNTQQTKSHGQTCTRGRLIWEGTSLRLNQQDVVTGWVQGGEGEAGVETIPRFSPGHMWEKPGDN